MEPGAPGMSEEQVQAYAGAGQLSSSLCENKDLQDVKKAAELHQTHFYKKGYCKFANDSQRHCRNMSLSLSCFSADFVLKRKI